MFRQIFFILFCFASKFLPAQDSISRSFYLSSAGNDLEEGTRHRPWKTLDKINSVKLTGWDTVFLTGGEIFTGTLILDKNDRGKPGKPLVIMSSGDRSCISYRNKTSPGAVDGGGFDFDGGITNSVMEDCLSFENQGSGYGIFQYDGASPWRNNIVRHSISINDGNGIELGGGVYIWNGMKDASKMQGLEFRNNIIINDTGTIIVYNLDNLHSGFEFFKNRFISRNPLTKGKDSSATDKFYKNSSGRPIDLKKFQPPLDPGEIRKYYKLLRRKS